MNIEIVDANSSGTKVDVDLRTDEIIAGLACFPAILMILFLSFVRFLSTRISLLILCNSSLLSGSARISNFIKRIYVLY